MQKQLNLEIPSVPQWTTDLHNTFSWVLNSLRVVQSKLSDESEQSRKDANIVLENIIDVLYSEYDIKVDKISKHALELNNVLHSLQSILNSIDSIQRMTSKPE